MGLGAKIVVAAVALGVLASPGTATTVLDQAQAAFASVRDEASAEITALRTGTFTGDPESTDQAAHSARGRATSYKFTVRDSQGRPGRWNPCSNIPIVVNPANAPAGAMNDLRTAVARVNAASGLRLQITGTTRERPTHSWGTVQRNGQSGWAPVMVAFASPSEGRLVDRDASGVTTPVWVTVGGREIFVSGQIVFNSDHNHIYRAGFSGKNARGELFAHELGHLAGLDHVNDPTQVMYPEAGLTDSFGRGDLRGLKAIGAGGCLDVPTPSWG